MAILTYELRGPLREFDVVDGVVVVVYPEDIMDRLPIDVANNVNEDNRNASYLKSMNYSEEVIQQARPAP